MDSTCWRLLLLLTVLAAPAAGAQTAAGGQLAWRCWYDQRTHVTCILQSMPEQLAPVDLPPNLPAAVRELRTDSGSFRHRFVHIPLISQAYDLRFAAVLARATVCGSRRDCTVNFDAVSPSAAELRTLEARVLEAEMEAALLGEGAPLPAQ